MKNITKITMKMKALYFGAMCMVSLSLAFYACSAGQQDWETDMESELELNAAMSRSMKVDTRLDSVMDSDEFMDFVVAYRALKSKMDSFFGNLTEAEMAKMQEAAVQSNIEDGRSIEEVDKLYNFAKNEMIAYGNAVGRLNENASFLKLTDEERNSLFKSAAASANVSPMMMKSRSEGDKCSEYRRLLAQADADFMSTMAACYYRYGPNDERPDYDPEYARCMFNARMVYEDRVQWIESTYGDCR